MLRAVDDAVLLDHADAEAREVVVVAVIHPRHLGGLAADERGAGLRAAFCDALDDGLRDVHPQLAGGVVVEEEERLRALHDDIVRAHGDEVDADRVVPAGVDGEAQLGAHAVSAGDQHRLLVAGGELDERAEAADARENFEALGAFRRPV